jgi:ADP-heptose:LPS heptosyltransferase
MPHRFSEINVRRILVSRLRFMGDVILTTPLCRALKRTFPHAQLFYLAETPFATLLEHNPDIDNVLPLDKQQDMSKMLLEMGRGHFDIAIDLFGNARSAILIGATRAPIRIGGNFRGRKYFYTHRISDNGEIKSAIDFHLSYLSPLLIETTQKQTHIVVSPEEKNQARDYLQSLGYTLDRPIIGIHPGASWPAKKWLSDRFAQLANALVHDMSAQVYFTHGPHEQSLHEQIVKLCTWKVPKTKVLTLRQLAAVLSHFDCFVSNDCGPMHLAPAVGTATVGIFGPGTPHVWFPYDPDYGHRLVFHSLDCRMCNRDFCETLDCMKSISVEVVLNAVHDSLLSRGRVH